MILLSPETGKPDPSLAAERVMLYNRRTVFLNIFIHKLKTLIRVICQPDHQKKRKKQVLGVVQERK